MKTTFDLSDDLVIAAKKRAAELKRPLRALVEEGLRAILAQKKPQRRPRRRLRFPTVGGALAPELDLRDRGHMHDWLRSKP